MRKQKDDDNAMEGGVVWVEEKMIEKRGKSKIDNENWGRGKYDVKAVTFLVGEVCAPVSCNWHIENWVRGYGIFGDLNWVTFFLTTCLCMQYLTTQRLQYKAPY